MSRSKVSSMLLCGGVIIAISALVFLESKLSIAGYLGGMLIMVWGGIRTIRDIPVSRRKQ